MNQYIGMKACSKNTNQL